MIAGTFRPTGGNKTRQSSAFNFRDAHERLCYFQAVRLSKRG